MEQPTTHVKKKPKAKQNGVSNLPFFIIGGVLLLYISVQLVSAFSSGVLTVPAKHVTVHKSFETTAYFVRNEHVVTGSASETAKHSVSSGQRVQAGAPLATMYTSEESLAKSAEAEQLSQEIEMLRGVLQMTEGEVDPAKIDQLIASELQGYFSAVRNGNGSAVTKQADSLRTLSIKRTAGQLDREDLKSQLASLEDKKTSVEGQIGGSDVQITAPVSGYFSEVVDGYESIYTTDILRDLTPESFETLQTMRPSTTQDGNFGKVVEGFSWYMVMEVPLAQATALSVGQDLEVEIISSSIQVPVRLSAIQKSTDTACETAVLVLEGTVFNSELVSMREQDVEIIENTYTGLEVPKEAVRVMEDEENGTTTIGVYIISGSVSSFKTIEIIYEADTYYVVKQSATNEKGLVAQDKIIIRGKDIQDKMLVKYNG